KTLSGTGITPLRIDFGYDNADRRSSETRYSDLAGTTLVGTTTRGYDDANRLTSLQHKDASNTNIANYGYGYDSADRLTSESRNGTTTNYTNDATGQLLGDGTNTYSYDANGNRTM